MSSDDHGPLVLTPTMLAERVRIVPVNELTDWPRNPYQPDVGAAHTYLGTFGQLTVPIVVDGEVLIGSELVDAERMDPQHGGSLAVLDLSDLGWPAEKTIAAVLGVHRQHGLTTVDGATLLDLLQEVHKANEPWLAGAGYDLDDMNAIYEQLQRDQEALDAMAGELTVEPDEAQQSGQAATEITCPECGHTWRAA